MRQRLGIAAALLGGPGTLIFDEPVNGLDPDGVHWVRQLMRSLAADGRTVLVSSHLMSEMSLTADRIVVMGRGKLVAEGSVDDIVGRSTGTSVLVRSPRASDLAAALVAAGGTVARGDADALTVTGMTAAAIGDAAAAHGFVLHELSPQQGSLEDAFLTLTRDSREFVAGNNQEAAR